MKIIWIYVLLINVWTFYVFGIDKRRALRNKWRIPEKNLFLFSLLGGAAGGLLGMLMFRHKIRKWYFTLGIPAILIMQTVGIGLLYHFGIFPL